MHHRLSLSWMAALLVLGLRAAPRAERPPPDYRVIVHPSSPATVLDRSFVGDAFLKKVRSWPGGVPIRPADLPLESHARRRFSEEVLRRSPEAVRAYWQQRIFSGRDVPPPELNSDREVIDWVTRYPGGIGYVSGRTHPEGVKVVNLQ